MNYSLKKWALAIFSILRIDQYIKNVFIFTPFFFSFNFQLPFINTIIAFILFSMVASCVYILNDIFDIEEDKQHPTKRYRPLASGLFNKKQALILAFFFLTTSLIIAFNFNISLSKILGIYFFLNIAYSIRLKHIAIVDIFLIAIGFVLRVYAGAVVIQINPTSWIIIMTFLLALFLAFAKRRDDVILAAKGKHTRKNIKGYNLEFINASMVLMAAVIIVSYIQYTFSYEVQQRLATNHLYLTTIFIILGISRYMQIVFVEKKTGDPTKIALKDRFLQLTILGWLAVFLCVVLK